MSEFALPEHGYGDHHAAILIDAAYELFGREGFHTVGLDRILADAGFSKQTFYNHFQSKDDLILAVLGMRHHAEARTVAELFAKLGGDDPRDRCTRCSTSSRRGSTSRRSAAASS
ncbi:MAG: TetR/AcrR family transcriptional regulator [Planctomycetota bacterium]|nr:TetR/AcrR family transcriptional regulator [Planctomycetota bacterium]